MSIEEYASRPHGLNSNPNEERLKTMEEMCDTQYNNSASHREHIVQRKEVKKSKGCLWKYVKKCIIYSNSISLSFN